MKYDKSLTEVWEWKEKVYEEYKHLTPEEYVARINKNAETMRAEAGIKMMVAEKQTKYNTER